jgi:deoxyadenosine/deoxycytidine kinase
MNWSIEGNIGAGKSTLGHALKAKYPKVYNLIPEPVQVWMDTGMLQSYYNDKKRWAYTFQNFALVTRLISWRKNKKLGMINLNDRSVFGDKEVFAKMLMHDGFMEPLEMAVYQEYHNLITEEDVPTLFIYLRTPVQTCAERIHERNRKAEDAIPLEYLQKVHDLHEQWIATLPKDRVLILDGTKSTDELVEEVHALFN